MQKNLVQGVRLELPHTVLNTEHEVKQALTTVVAWQLFTSSLDKENCVSRSKMPHGYT